MNIRKLALRKNRPDVLARIRVSSKISAPKVFNKKYAIGSDHRIIALRDFGSIKKGEVGGVVDSTKNLSQRGNCWIDTNATVRGNARVTDDSQVTGTSVVRGNTLVSGYSVVHDSTLNSGIHHDARLVDTDGRDQSLTRRAVVVQSTLTDRGYASATVFNTVVAGKGQVTGKKGTLVDSSVSGRVHVKPGVETNVINPAGETLVIKAIDTEKQAKSDSTRSKKGRGAIVRAETLRLSDREAARLNAEKIDAEAKVKADKIAAKRDKAQAKAKAAKEAEARIKAKAAAKETAKVVAKAKAEKKAKAKAEAEAKAKAEAEAKAKAEEKAKAATKAATKAEDKVKAKAKAEDAFFSLNAARAKEAAKAAQEKADRVLEAELDEPRTRDDITKDLDRVQDELDQFEAKERAAKELAAKGQAAVKARKARKAHKSRKGGNGRKAA